MRRVLGGIVALALGTALLALAALLVPADGECTTSALRPPSGAWQDLLGPLLTMTAGLLTVGWIWIRRLEPAAYAALTPLVMVWPMVALLAQQPHCPRTWYQAVGFLGAVVPVMLAAWSWRLHHRGLEGLTLNDHE